MDMEELRNKAIDYAEENVFNVLKETFAKVYADGYRDGVKDREKDVPVDLLDGETQYVDLGLPSGTLWSLDYKKVDDKREYLPYAKAKLLSIPTKGDWDELRKTCKWVFDIDKSFGLCKARCVGPNGNVLEFIHTGKMDLNTLSEMWEVFFWVKDEKDGNEKSAVHMYNGGKKLPGPFCKSAQTVIEDFFVGYKLPIRLVRK